MMIVALTFLLCRQYNSIVNLLLTKTYILPDVLRQTKPLAFWMLRGFSFLVGDYMTDKVQAKQDLEFCSAELSKYQNLSRSGLTRNELLAIDGIMIKLKERIKNLRLSLHL